ncbi:hypothetical protein EWM64_g6645 [Hericium alpestre]|uniref:Uncharacterized protein n=1 Tax=Hericium alpestre TaxID=135208 RepID=A0A4Y9ZTI5_9AGAM|nr:hypothetical protein EWM64_g6645 [Hericium alpestre]
MSTDKSLYRIKGSVNNYPWGAKGSSSLVAQLAPNSIGPSFKLEEDKPYSELWIGTHPHGPAHLLSEAQSLQELITSNPVHHLGLGVLHKFKYHQLPYLFKVLSVGRALPLQAHPSKPLAHELHRKDPAQFVDSNSKPEIAVAIGANGSVEQFLGLPLLHGGNRGEDATGVAFTGFVGFQPLEQIAYTLDHTPELRNAIDNLELVAKFIRDPQPAGLKEVYSDLLNRGAKDKDDVAAQISAYLKRVASSSQEVDANDEGQRRMHAFGKVARKVDSEYQGDVGVFATVFFLNLVQLRRSEAVFIDADEIHAYLEGGAYELKLFASSSDCMRTLTHYMRVVDIIECMATSDNVLNAAFPPPPPGEKVDELGSFERTLNYTAAPPAHWALPTTPFKGHTTAYRPPLEEFIVLRTSLAGFPESLGRVGPTVGIVLKGAAKFMVGAEQELVDRGGVVFVSAGSEVVVEAQGDWAEIWWATCEA